MDLEGYTRDATRLVCGGGEQASLFTMTGKGTNTTPFSEEVVSIMLG